MEAGPCLQGTRSGASAPGCWPAFWVVCCSQQDWHTACCCSLRRCARCTAGSGWWSTATEHMIGRPPQIFHPSCRPVRRCLPAWHARTQAEDHPQAHAPSTLSAAGACAARLGLATQHGPRAAAQAAAHTRISSMSRVVGARCTQRPHAAPSGRAGLLRVRVQQGLLGLLPCGLTGRGRARPGAAGPAGRSPAGRAGRQPPLHRLVVQRAKDDGSPRPACAGPRFSGSELQGVHSHAFGESA